MKILLVIGVEMALASCTSSSARMYECELQGISRDACYGPKGTETNKHHKHYYDNYGDE